MDKRRNIRIDTIADLGRFVRAIRRRDGLTQAETAALWDRKALSFQQKSRPLKSIFL